MKAYINFYKKHQYLPVLSKTVRFGSKPCCELIKQGFSLVLTGNIDKIEIIRATENYKQFPDENAKILSSEVNEEKGK